jgi:hAT family C-terminal dimerisation region
MKKRWKDWEQPLLLLSIALHPSYRLSKFRSTVKNLTWTHIGQWLKYYYLAFFGTPAKTILSELIDYKRGDDPYDDDSFLQFQGNVLNFWESTMGIGQELAKVAIHIHSICVNSASVERLWSSMGFFHTNRRNRLEVCIFIIYYYIII